MFRRGRWIRSGRTAGTALLAVLLILLASYWLLESWPSHRPSGRVGAVGPPAAVAAPMMPRDGKAATAVKEESEPVQLLWERPLAAVIHLALSPDGGALAVLSLAGSGGSRSRTPAGGEGGSEEQGSVRLRLYARDGALRWERWVEGCSRAVVGRGGDVMVTYEPQSALSRTLCLRSGDGHLEGAWRFDEPITAVSIADDGRRVAVGSHGGEVRLLQREGATWRRMPGWQAEPPVHAVAFGPGESVWVLAGVLPVLACHEPDGSLLWRSRPWDGKARSLSFSASADGQFAAVAGEREPKGAVEVQLWSARGRRLWRAGLKGRAPHVRLASSESDVIVAYENALSRRARGRVFVERALTAFDPTGSERWTRKGGAFFSPLLIAVEPHGDWVLSLGLQSKFWLLGRRGETRWRSISHPPVQVAVGSRNGRSVAAYRVDGRLMMLAIEK